ncbi:tetratricopeptide repeat protein [bacterium]|nr:tetratricopeptide repeat protein [bacterium]
MPEHSAAAVPEAELTQVIDQALRATREMDHRRANQLLERAVTSFAPGPELELARLILAETSLVVGRWEQARRELDSLLESPSNVEVRIRAELALGELFFMRGEPEKAREYLHKAGQLAEYNSLPRWTLECTERQAALAGQTGEMDLCRDLLEQAEIQTQAFQRDPTWAELSAALDSQWGLYHFRLSQRDSAEKRLNKALQTLRNGQCRSLAEPRILRYLGVMASQRLDHQLAMNLHLEALALYTQAGHVFGQAKVYDSIGRTLQGANRLTEAVLTFKKSECLCLQLGANAELATLYGKLGQVAMLAEDMDGAIEYFQRDLELSSRNHNDYALGYSYRNLGRCLMQVGRFEEAVTNLNESVALFQNVEDWGNLARVYMDLGFACAKSGDPEEASEMRRRAAGLFQEHGLHREMTFLGCLDGMLARAENRLEESEIHFRTCIEALVGGSSGVWLSECFCELGILYRQFNMVGPATQAFKSAARTAKGAGLSRQVNRYLHELESLDEIELIQFWMEDLPEPGA